MSRRRALIALASVVVATLASRCCAARRVHDGHLLHPARIDAIIGFIPATG